MDTTILVTDEGAESESESETKRTTWRRFDFIKQRRRHVLAALEAELGRARAEVPGLERCPSAAEASRLLKRRPDDPEKMALTEALLLAVRLGHAALSDLLIVGYLPTLEYVLGFGATLVGDADLAESMVLQAFTEAAADYRGLLANPCVYLFRETRRRFRRMARREHRDHSHLELADLRELDGHRVGLWESKADPGQASASVRASNAESQEELVALLRSNVGDRVPREQLALVEATLLGGEALPDYVDRVFPGLGERDRQRTYERLKRQRSRTVGALREVLAPWRAEVLGEDLEPGGERKSPEPTAEERDRTSGRVQRQRHRPVLVRPRPRPVAPPPSVLW